MIIESGIDLVQVLCGSFGDDDPTGLWILAMDENLRLLTVEPVVRHDIDSVESHVDEIAMFVDEWSRVQYFALAWSQHMSDDETMALREIDERLRGRSELAGARMLGSIVFDGTRLYASVPRCDFSFEPEYRDLPRALPIHGPHGLDCACPPCSADRRAFDESYDQPYDDRYNDGYDDRYDDPYGDPYDGRYGGPHSGSYGGSYDAPYGNRRSGADSTLRYGDLTFDPLWKRWIPRPERAGKRWTTDEEETITQSHFAGLSCFDISILVRRQPGAVASRLNKLGMSSRTYLPERDYPGSVIPPDSLTLADPPPLPPPPDR